MRDMTEAELTWWYDQRRWPCGHKGEFLAGPAGCGMRNIQCAECLLRLNVVDPFEAPEMPFVPRLGKVIHEPPGYKCLELPQAKLAPVSDDQDRRWAKLARSACDWAAYVGRWLACLMHRSGRM